MVGAIFVSITYAQASDLNLECVGKVVSAVNAHHSLAEGSAYAVKVLHNGVFGAALLVGHSDETEPTDYLVVVGHNKKNCEVKSITVSDESSVSEYSNADEKLLLDATMAYKKVLVAKGLEMMKAIPNSGYDTKVLCIGGDNVTALVPMTHWSKNDRKTMLGTLKQFPIRTIQNAPKIDLEKNEKGELVSGTEFNGVFATSGYVDHKMVDLCLFESKPVLE